MVQAKQLEVIHSALIDSVFVSTNDVDECDTEEGPLGILYHRSKIDQAPRSVTITGFKAAWSDTRAEVSETVSRFLGVTREVVESRITASIQPDLC